jgi:prepilin-type N-terminal cleavage/methylation domain-containing protein
VKKQKMKKRKFFKNGFTLVELLLVIIITSVLATAVLFIVNPIQQINKAMDTQRVKDLSTIATSLDTYYNDKNCYPQSVPFGDKWDDNSTTYLKKVPNDPKQETNGNYVYVTDKNSSCSQWSVVFSKLSTEEGSCPLPSGCVPAGYETHWACKVLGNPDCDVVTQTQLASPTATMTPPTPTPSGLSGVCMIRDAFTSVPTASDPDVGHGYAKLFKQGINTIAGLRVACGQSDYDILKQEYCAVNHNSFQEEVMTFQQNGHWNETGCGAITCNFISCAGSGGPTPTFIPTPTATGSAH